MLFLTPQGVRKLGKWLTWGSWVQDIWERWEGRNSLSMCALAQSLCPRPIQGGVRSLVITCMLSPDTYKNFLSSFYPTQLLVLGPRRNRKQLRENSRLITYRYRLREYLFSHVLLTEGYPWTVGVTGAPCDAYRNGVRRSRDTPHRLYISGSLVPFKIIYYFITFYSQVSFPDTQHMPDTMSGVRLIEIRTSHGYHPRK